MPNRFVIKCVLFCWLVFGASAQAADKWIDLSQIKPWFPAADEVSALSGEPPASRIYSQGRVIGYAYFTDDVISMPAYSGKPISTLVAFDTNGKITGLRIVHHEEPILVVGISDQDLQRFLDQYVGKYVNDKLKIGGQPRDDYKVIDAISGATITMMVLNATVTRSMVKVAQAQGVLRDESGTSASVSIEQQPVWIHLWQERIFQIVVLSIGLLVLLTILFMQDWLARHPTLLRHLRTGFLAYTVLFIGWYLLAQLSVVNVLTFVNSLFHEFSWENFLIDPAMFLLWGFVAVTLLLWGRGVYCGWLCPYGALQEFVFRLGAKLRIRSFEFPEVVHERLWAIKYIILLGLFAMSLQSMTMAETYAEVEPFKTAITLRFQREWGYVFYAGLMLAVSLFNRKFYCRYICPLGAALTFPSKFRIFEWLRRRKECGRPCQICRNECEVGAIRTTGEIIDTECHYCLDCQVTYWNSAKCPPLADKRRRQERFAKTSGSLGVKPPPGDPPT